MKDYYLLLGIEPSATTGEIKKAYRSLAHQYHPDKNSTDPYAAARFAEIKEAYEVLTNPAKKEYYLEQRWFEQAMGRKKKDPVITPESVLKKAIEFDRHVSRLDVHRMNKEGLFQYVQNDMLSMEVIEKLNAFGEKQANREIILFILKTLYAIPSTRSAEMEKILLGIHSDPETENQVKIAFQKMKRDNEKEKYKVWIVLLVVMAIVLIIYFLG